LGAMISDLYIPILFGRYSANKIDTGISNALDIISGLLLNMCSIMFVRIILAITVDKFVPIVVVVNIHSGFSIVFKRNKLLLSFIPLPRLITLLYEIIDVSDRAKNPSKEIAIKTIIKYIGLIS